MEKTFYDASGKPYTVNLLSRLKIENILSRLRIYPTVLEAWRRYSPGIDTVICLNCESGNIEYRQYSGNSGDIEAAPLIPIYCIDGNVEGNNNFQIDDILSESEYIKASKLVKSGKARDIYEALWVLNIDYDERFGEALAYYAAMDFNRKELYNHIDNIYNKEETTVTFMTKEESIRLSINMWRWLAKTGLGKSDYLYLIKKLTPDEILMIRFQCYLCKYQESSRSKKCPVFGRRCYCECLKSKYHYVNWYESETTEERKYFARLIYLALRRYYEKRYGHHKIRRNKNEKNYTYDD